MLDNDTLQQPSPLKVIDSSATPDAVIDRTGDVAASEGHCELNVDAMILDVYLNGGEYSFTMENGNVVDIHRAKDKKTVNFVVSPESASAE